MKVNVYYGGRGLIDDPTLYAIEKVIQVLEELDVSVERFNLYENKSGISVLPKTLKDVDGVVLASSLEWFGIGGYLQEFLDACWLYGDKESVKEIYMLPLVMATTYGERESVATLTKAWEMLGGIPCDGICAYVENHTEFEMNRDYAYMIEKKAEDFYRSISKKAKRFPNSISQIKKRVMRSNRLSLTPQESAQLSAYVSNDNYVRKQKEDIEELASLFEGMLDGDEEDIHVKGLKEGYTGEFNEDTLLQIKLTDLNKNIVIKVNSGKLEVELGEVAGADVSAKTVSTVLNEIIAGKRLFQNAFMSGDMSASGDFKKLKNFDEIFKFEK